MKREIPLATVLTLLKRGVESRLRCRIHVSVIPTNNVVAVVDFLSDDGRAQLSAVIYKDDTFAFKGEAFLKVFPEDLALMADAIKRCISFMEIFSILPKLDSL